ncbi:hypothetical protein BCR36DRAFT_300706, partial [Piromyces finnis]
MKVLIQNFINNNEFFELKSYLCFNDITIKQVYQNCFDILTYSMLKPTHLEIIFYIISNYENVNYETKDGNIPLFIALEKHQLKVAAYLLKRGAQINFRNNQGETVLLYLLKKKLLNITLLNFILTNGIDINAKDINNKCFLDYARDERLVKRVFMYYIFNNDFIFNMVSCSKNRYPICRKTFCKRIKAEIKKIDITKSIYYSVVDNQQFNILKIILSY